MSGGLVQPRPTPATRPWFRRHAPAAAVRTRLIALHHAGGSASMFRSWAAALPASTELIAVQLPGREDRIHEPPYRDAAPIVEALADELAPLLLVPFALFGHSMGALLAFELARALRRRGASAPLHLFVSGRGAPHIPGTLDALSDAPSAKLFASLGGLGGLPDAVLANRELLALVEPALRADLAVCERYRFDDDAPLATPITAFGGELDASVPAESLAAWQAHSTMPLAVRMFPGDHFFVASDRDAVVSELARVLAA